MYKLIPTHEQMCTSCLSLTFSYHSYLCHTEGLYTRIYMKLKYSNQILCKQCYMFIIICELFCTLLYTSIVLIHESGISSECTSETKIIKLDMLGDLNFIVYSLIFRLDYPNQSDDQIARHPRVLPHDCLQLQLIIALKYLNIYIKKKRNNYVYFHRERATSVNKGDTRSF